MGHDRRHRRESSEREELIKVLAATYALDVEVARGLLDEAEKAASTDPYRRSAREWFATLADADAAPLWPGKRTAVDNQAGSSRWRATGSAPVPGKRTRAMALSGPRRAPTAGASAHVSVRALDAAGQLIAEWSGTGHGPSAMPSQLVGSRQGTRWTWRWAGVAGPAEEPQVDDDARPASTWAPADAIRIVVDYRSVDAPFGAAPDESAGATPGRRFVLEPAAGAEPVAGGIPEIVGPLAIGAEAESGDLTVRQDADWATFDLGRSRVMVGGNPRNPDAQYRYRVAPQSSPRQRVIHVVAGWHAIVRETPDPEADVELAVQVERVRRDDPRLDPPPQGIRSIRLADVVASGDENRVILAMDRNRLEITAATADARFAYYVDPLWTGDDHTERRVHIVATPGVTVAEDDVPSPTLDASGSRRLVANPIYVQDPALVPTQGTPIDPARFLQARHHPRGDDPRDGLSLYTGSAGVTLRDERLGATVAIRVVDPEKGGRFAYELDLAATPRPELRVVTSPGVEVEVREPQRHLPTDHQDPYRDIHNADVVVHEAARADVVPPQGTPLPMSLLVVLGLPRPPHRVQEPPKSAGQIAGEVGTDLAIGAMPGIGDVADLAELGYAVTSGTDKWGNPLSTGELIVMGIAALLPFIGVGIVKAGRGAARAGRAASELEKLAARLGRTTEEVEVLTTQLQRMSPASAAAVGRMEAALQSGEMIAHSDFWIVQDALRAMRMGDMPMPQGARLAARGVPPGATVELAGAADDVGPAAAHVGAPAPAKAGRVGTHAPLPPRITSASGMNKPNRIVGLKTFAKLHEAEAVLRQIGAGDLGVITRELDVLLPKGFTTSTGLEFGLGELPDGGFVIVRGEISAVDWSALPGVKPLAHVHPSAPGNDLALDRQGIRRLALTEITQATVGQHLERAKVFPSPSDFQVMSDQGIPSHRVLTPYVVQDGFVMKPDADWAGGDARLEFLILDAAHAGELKGAPVHSATLVGTFDGNEVLRKRVFTTSASDDAPDGRLFLEEPPGLVETAPNKPSAPASKTGSASEEDAAKRLAELRTTLTDDATAELETMSEGLSAAQTWVSLEKAGDPARFLEGRARKKLNAGPRAAAADALIAATHRRLQATEFFDSPLVRHAIADQDETDLIGRVAEHLARLNAEAEYPTSAGHLVLDDVDVSRRLDGYHTVAEVRASVPDGKDLPLYELDGAVWQRLTNIDVMVLRDREITSMREVKAGGSPSAAKTQQEAGLEAMMSIARGDETIRLHHHRRTDITDRVDAATADRDKLKTVGPDNKGFEMKLGMTHQQLTRLTRELLVRGKEGGQ